MQCSGRISSITVKVFDRAICDKESHPMKSRVSVWSRIDDVDAISDSGETVDRIDTTEYGSSIRILLQDGNQLFTIHAE